MSVFALGLNHNTAPLDLRGRFAFAPEQLGGALRGLSLRTPRLAAEAALVSTCNRTELYVAAGAPAQDLARPTLDWLAEQGGVPASRLEAHSYQMHDREAARHAFRVASGLDSMVLGEPQILGQMKQAVRMADEAARVRCHRLVHREHAADHRPGRRRARAQAAAPPPDVPGRPGRAA
ncbi:MAG: hypothetical protein GX886_04570, partial [Comamonadaceae bacterium]|nr:hypothetical protein [Comamonadaceae bacterium]